MYTEAILSQTNGRINSIQSSTQTATSFERYIGSKHVWPDSGIKQASGDFSRKQKDLNLKLERIKNNIETRLRILLNNTSYKSLLKDVEFVDIESFKEFLRKSKIPDETRRILELCLLIFITLEKNKKIAKNTTEIECKNDNTHKFDLCGEIVNQIVNFKDYVDKKSELSLELLVNICIWTVETVEVTNLVQLCYELLLNILRSGFRSEVVSLFIRNGILDKSSIISLISYTESQYQQIYWKIRILQVAVSKGILIGEDLKYVREFAINSTKLRNKSIYILDESVCLLAQIWLIERVEFDIDFNIKLRILTKLLTVGDHSFLENFSLNLLTKISIVGPLEERKLCLKCISLIPEKVDKEDVIKNIESLLYKNNFRRYKSLLPKMDLGILTVGVRFLGDIDTSLSYLDRLHNLINNIAYWNIANKSFNLSNNNRDSNSSSTNKTSTTALSNNNKEDKNKTNKEVKSKTHNNKNKNHNRNKNRNNTCSNSNNDIYNDYVVMLKILSDNRISGINNKTYIKDRIKRIKINLKKYYYSIFELVNAVIATRSYISTINSMAIKIDYTYDLTLYLLLSMDANYTSICRDYIKVLTISTNHIDFNFIGYVMEIIKMSYLNCVNFENTENNDSSWIFRILLSGICNYFEVLFQYNVKDIYGTNHQRINQLCEEIISLFRFLICNKENNKNNNEDNENKENKEEKKLQKENKIKRKMVFKDYSLLVQMVKVLKVIYVYNENMYEGIIEIFIRIIKEIDRNKIKDIEDIDNDNKEDKNKTNKEVKSKTQEKENIDKDIKRFRKRGVRYKEKMDGYTGELMETLCELYEKISSRKIPYRVQEFVVMCMVNQQCTGYVVRGLINSVVYNGNRRLIQLIINQLVILQTLDWESEVFYYLRKLVNLVFFKINRLNCKLVYIGNIGEEDLHIYKFQSYKFRISQDSINKTLKQHLKYNLINIKQVNEIKLFDCNYSLSPDVVHKYTHDCPGE